MIVIKTEYFPPISTLSCFGDGEVYIEACENYQKKSYRNRTTILSANGPSTLSVPLSKGKNNNTPIKEVKISYQENWTMKHLQAIKSAYGNAPYFHFYFDDIQSILEKKPHNLWDLNNEVLKMMIEAIGISTEIKETTSFVKDYEEDVLDVRFSNPDTNKNAYNQVFEDKFGFVSGLSSLDLLMCKGPESIMYL